MRIGFIGLGAMGLPMSRNLAAADGIDVTFHDVRSEALASVAGLGATATSIAELVAGVDVVFSVLPADEQMEEAANLGRRATSLPPDVTDPAVAPAIAAGTAAAQTLISLEALALAARSSLSAAEAAEGMETGPGGNESLRRLAGAQEVAGPWTLGGLLDDLDGTLAMAERVEAPAIAFELTRQLALALIDRHGADAEVVSLA